MFRSAVGGIRLFVTYVMMWYGAGEYRMEDGGMVGLV